MFVERRNGNRREYAERTFLELEPGPFAVGFVRGRAKCPDDVVRALMFPNRYGVPDTFFSIPARVKVRVRGQQLTVSGFATITHDGVDDPEVVRFIPNTEGKNAAVFA